MRSAPSHHHCPSRPLSAPLRLGCALIAATGFAALILAANRLACNVHLSWISEDTLRNAAHFLVYGLLALLLAVTLGPRHMMLTWWITALLATTEELHQIIVPGRFATVHDWLLNLAGISFFLIALAALHVLRSLPHTAADTHGGIDAPITRTN